MSKKTEAGGESLSVLAERLVRLVGEHREARNRAAELQGFATRRSELDRVLSKVKPLANALALLKKECDVSKVAVPGVKRLRERVEQVRQKFLEDSSSILAPRTLETISSDDTFKGFQDRLLAVWKEFVGVDSQDKGIAAVLKRYERYRPIASAVEAINEELVRRAGALPSATEDVSRVRALKRQLATQVKSLQSGGLDEEILDFLRRSVEGVPLKELLSKVKVLKWIEDERLASEFRVKSV